jgi:GAF domain-containing protein
MSVPVELGGGPVGTLDVYTVDPRDWDDTEVSALQAYAGVVASPLAAAASAELKDALAEQLQTALDARVLVEQADGALMERERRRPTPAADRQPNRDPALRAGD